VADFDRMLGADAVGAAGRLRRPDELALLRAETQALRERVAELQAAHDTLHHRLAALHHRLAAAADSTRPPRRPS
jgi:hypothetical protein